MCLRARTLVYLSVNIGRSGLALHSSAPYHANQFSPDLLECAYVVIPTSGPKTKQMGVRE